MNHSANIFIKPENKGLITRASEVAERLQGAVLIEDGLVAAVGSVVVFISERGISLVKMGSSENPVFIDFTAKKIQYRQKNSGTRKEALARAVGMKKGEAINIVDASAGLGGDSFILAALGANMLMLERNPLVHLLLEDAILRAKHDINLQGIMENMQLINADSITYLDGLETRPDVIYMDPMFPDKTKTALSKKEMRLFREIAGADEDVNLLLEKALQKASRRVVIKRPRKSPYVNNMKPHFDISGKSSRFDVYMV